MPGPYYFAWVGAGVPFSDDLVREDEEVFYIQISHAESNFPSLMIDLKNPQVGLLAAGRNVWCWLSWFDGEVVQPIFNGRLVGVPQNIQDEVVRLQFVAIPEDYLAQKQALADALKVAPYWDPLWLADKQDDPDTVLEAYTRLWHVDRVSLEATTSDILLGEDGTLVFTESDHFYEALGVSYGQTPLRRVNVEGAITWDQHAEDEINITRLIYKEFGGDEEIQTFTGDGLQSSWPQPDASIGGGWSVGASSLTLKFWTTTMNYIILFSRFLYSDTATSTQDENGRYIEGIVYKALFIIFQLDRFSCTFNVKYSATRKRSETVVFTVEADIQALMTEPGTAEEESIKLTASTVGLTVDPDGALPIVDVRRSSYFKTDRGGQSLQYLFALAKAKLSMRSRAVLITFETTWARGIALSCRYSAEVQDRRLPGGSVTGKVTNYVLTSDPSRGEIAQVTIECCIGYGGTASTTVGSPTWADADYVDSGYQVETGGTLDFDGLGQLVYQSLDDFDIDDDGVDFFRITGEEYAKVSVTGKLVEQMAAVTLPLEGEELAPGLFKKNDPIGALRAIPTTITLDMVPVTGGPFNTFFPLAVSHLKLPQTVDLEHA